MLFVCRLVVCLWPLLLLCCYSPPPLLLATALWLWRLLQMIGLSFECRFFSVSWYDDQQPQEYSPTSTLTFVHPTYIIWFISSYSRRRRRRLTSRPRPMCGQFPFKMPWHWLCFSWLFCWWWWCTLLQVTCTGVISKCDRRVMQCSHSIIYGRRTKSQAEQQNHHPTVVLANLKSCFGFNANSSAKVSWHYYMALGHFNSSSHSGTRENIHLKK